MFGKRGDDADGEGLLPRVWGLEAPKEIDAMFLKPCTMICTLNITGFGAAFEKFQDDFDGIGAIG